MNSSVLSWFRPKSQNLAQDRQFQAQMRQHESPSISEVQKQTTWKFIRMLEHKIPIAYSYHLQHDDVTTNPMWRTYATLKIILGYRLSRRHIVRLTRNLEWRCRITCHMTWHVIMSRDQSSKLWNFKMADGRRFENVFSLYILAANHPMSMKFYPRILISRMVTWWKI